jgi:hypothetical protein
MTSDPVTVLLLRVALTPWQHFTSLTALTVTTVLYPGWWNHTTPYR